MSNNIKAIIFLLIFIFLVIGVTSKVAAQVGIKPLGNMPTATSCNCKIYKAVSSSNSTTFKTGTATVYNDGVMFDFGGAVIVLREFKEDVFVSDKGDIWIAVTDTAGDRVFRNKKKYIWYSLTN